MQGEMAGYRRGGERTRGSLRDVYVARTVREPQREVERFLNRCGRHLGFLGTINTIGSTHLTFLQTGGVMRHFRSHGYGPDEVREFKGRLETWLKDRVDGDRTAVEVDDKRPLKWMNRRTLALNLVPNEMLMDTRGEIEAFLEEQFGELSNLMPFDPHITIGWMRYQVGAAERRDPRVLLPESMRIPSVVALNGLETYLGKTIHARTPQQ